MHTAIKKAGASNGLKMVSKVVGGGFANIGGSAGGVIILSAKSRKKKETKPASRFKVCGLYGCKHVQFACMIFTMTMVAAMMMDCNT